MEPRINMLANEIGAKITKRIANASLVITQSTLPKATQDLVRLRASQINGCGCCVNIHTKEAEPPGETPIRLNLAAAWREATVFTEAERAALALGEEGTRLADTYHGVSDETWASSPALRRRPDRRAGLPGRHDQRGQPVRRDRAQPGGPSTPACSPA